MNRLSLKVKLTMLYTFFMILVTCAGSCDPVFLKQQGGIVLHKSEAGEAGAEQYG